MLNLKNTVHLIIDGDINKMDIDTIFNQMKEIVTYNKEVNLLIEVEDIEGVKNLKTIFSSLKTKWFAVKHLRKYAIVTDKDWLENLSDLVNFLTPGIEIKTFDNDEQKEAIDWINAPTDNEKHGMVMMKHEAYLHVFVNDKLTKADYTILKKEMSRYDDKVSLLVEIGYYEGLTIQAFLEDLKMGFSSYGKIKNIALVSDEKISILVKSADFVTPGLDLKLFKNTEMHDAIDWLKK